jgi:hypothetical protein
VFQRRSINNSFNSSNDSNDSFYSTLSSLPGTPIYDDDNEQNSSVIDIGDLANYTIRKLKSMAKKEGITGYSKKSKDNLVDMLRNYYLSFNKE